MNKYLTISFMLMTLLGCGDNSSEPTKSEQKIDLKSDEITAKEISDALGMQRVTILIPEGPSDLSYGFTIMHKDGVLPMGFTKYKPGSKLHLLYWPEGNFLKYSIQGDASSSSGLVEIDQTTLPFIKSRSGKNETYAPGEIFEKWSVNSQFTSSGRVETLINGGEIGLCFIRKTDDLKFSKLNLHPVEEVKPGF